MFNEMAVKWSTYMSHSTLIPLRSATLALYTLRENPRDTSRGNDLGTTTKSGKTRPQYLTSVLLSPGNNVFYPLPWSRLSTSKLQTIINHLNAELNPICHLLALLGAHHILHVSRIRVNDQSQTFKIRKPITMSFSST